MRRKRPLMVFEFVLGLTLAFALGAASACNKKSTEIPKDKSPASKVVEPAPGAARGFASGIFDESSAKPAKAKAKRSKVPAHFCESIEIPGDGTRATLVSDESWAKVNSLFYAAKGGLGKWLDNHSKQIPPKTLESMRAKLEALWMERPPSLDEPDLAWRGIGVWGTDPGGTPYLRVGGGFIKLALENETRAKFELSRLAAQTWAPCELAQYSDLWNPLLQCLHIKEKNGCEDGGYSTSGWAVSTVLGVVVAPPGCTIPAFERLEFQKCVEEVPLPATAHAVRHSSDVVLAQSARKEAR